MEYKPPSIPEIAEHLRALDRSALLQLAETSGVPFGTLWKIRAGTTTNPRLATFQRLVPHLREKESAPEASCGPMGEERRQGERRNPPPAPDSPPPAFGDRRVSRDRRSDRPRAD